MFWKSVTIVAAHVTSSCKWLHRDQSPPFWGSTLTTSPTNNALFNRLPPELRRKSFATKHQPSIRVGAKRGERRACNVCKFRRSFHFCMPQLAVGFLACTSTAWQPSDKQDQDGRVETRSWTSVRMVVEEAPKGTGLRPPGDGGMEQEEGGGGKGSSTRPDSSHGKLVTLGAWASLSLVQFFFLTFFSPHTWTAAIFLFSL